MISSYFIRKKVCRDKTILDIDNFVVLKNKFNFIIGGNGSGKTTLLNILSLVDQDYRGQFYYKSRNINKEEQNLKLRRKFSVIWQDPYLYRGNVYYNIALPLKLRDCSPKLVDRKVKEIAKKLEIENLLHQSAHTLSGGERQKASIARALITEPEVLFVDEVTTNLDEESIHFFNSHFADLVTAEMTVVMVSHDRRQIKN
jgi:tungstate transport system ATP-binding protein